jgi:serine phosphatase RsbU (regulator of sigma subunit)
VSQSVPRFAASGLRLLLVEDDEGDAVLVREALHVAGVEPTAITWVRTLADAIRALNARPHCVLLDLALPDADGLTALRSVVETSPTIAVIVLTGRHNPSGLDVLATGAEDYLVKDDVSAELLHRSIRYAIERKRAQATALQLHEARRASAERSRLERGLLPTPLLRTGAVECISHYQPGRDHAVLGGDFFDVVEVRDGVVRAVVGDVMGHGPDEAALGVHLRVAWRTLILGGTPDHEILPALQRLLAAEADERTGFVTACDVTLYADDETLTLRVAGHPAPLRCQDGTTDYLDVVVGPPLGLSGIAVSAWPETTENLKHGSSLLLYTDGLLDTYLDDDRVDSLGIDELVEAANKHLASGDSITTWLRSLVRAAPRSAADDTAVVGITLIAP